MNYLTKYFYNLILLYFAIIVSLNVFAQPRHFRKLPTQEGDVNLSVRQIIQDNTGFLWLATFSGLYRFEGDEFIREHQFLNNERINSDVTSLLQDNENNIWIGTNNGLSKYNPETEELTTFYNQQDNGNSIGSNKIRSLAMDAKNRIWIGTADAGLFLFNSQENSFRKINFEPFTINQPIYIKSIFPAKDGKIWLGTLGSGLYNFSCDKNGVTELRHYHTGADGKGLSNNWVYSIFQDTDNTIAVGTQNGLNVYNQEADSFCDVSTNAFVPGSLTNYFRTIFRDKQGQLWIGTWKGLIRCNNFSDILAGRFDLLEHDRSKLNSISHSQVMDIFEDKSGVIWVATENGLNVYDPFINQFQALTGPVIDALTEQTATDFCPYNDGILIMTLSDGVLFKDDNKVTSFYQEKLQAFNNEKFYCIYADSEKNIWAGSFNGLLVRKDREKGEISIFKHSGNNIPIYSICEVRKNLLAIGTGKEGVKYFDICTSRFIPDPGLSANVEVNKVLVDYKKRLWVATQLGIFKKEKNENSFEYYLPDNPDKTTNPNIFIDIAESASGEIFVAGRNGLYLYNEENYEFEKMEFDTEAQLWITNLQFDSEHNLWLNLNFNKIAQWNRKTGKFQTYSVNNGIRSSAFNHRGFFIDKNDKIYTSGFDQIFEFDIKKVVPNTFSPKPVITDLIINNTDVRPGMQLNNQEVLLKNIRYTDAIVLNNQNKDFTLRYSSATFLNAKENKYRYILHGYDQNWHESTGRETHYTNLGPGKYTFEVESANNDGMWSSESATLQIRIKPKPLMSPVAIALYIVFIVAMGAITWRIIDTRMKLRSELLIEKVKRDKEEKFNQERLRFYTNISHELRTPLTLILGPTKELIAGDNPNSTTSKLHQLVLNNSQRLLSLVNQLLDFRKSLYQGMKLKVTQTNLVEIIESNIAAFNYMAEEKHIKVDFKTEERKLKGWYDLEKLDIILFNILSNAFKYSPEYGFVSLELTTSEANVNLQTKHVEIRISNTGKGIPKHLQQKIFERFYQVEENKSKSNVNTGTGIGLALVKNLVELHHGNITVESEQGKSTTFSVFLPINREDYQDEEIFDFSRDADRRTKELIKTVDARNEESIYEKKDTDRKKILIVEDNMELRDYLAGFLSEDYKIYTAVGSASDFSTAAQLAETVIASDEYRLLNSFAEVFDYNNQQNDEIIWSAQFSTNNQFNGAGNNQYQLFMFGFEPYLGMNRTSDYGRSNPTWQPTSFFYNLFVDGDSREAVTLDRTLYAVEDAGGVVKGDTVIYFPKVAWTQEQKDAVSYAVYNPDEYMVNTDFGSNQYPIFRKFKDPFAPYGDNGGTRDANIFRLAETYLIAAEAQLQAGKPDLALAHINTIRNRAADGVNLSLSSVTIDDILNERALELAGETSRWIDLKRTGKLSERVLAHNPHVQLHHSSEIDSHYLLRPIPENEILLTNGALVQNPGY